MPLWNESTSILPLDAFLSQSTHALWNRKSQNLGLLKWIIPELRVLALTKRHVGSGNEMQAVHNRSQSFVPLDQCIAYVIKVLTRIYPLSRCYITFYATRSTRLKWWWRILVNDFTSFFQGGQKVGYWYITSYFFNILNLHWWILKKACVLHVKRVIEPQRSLNTNYQCKHGLFFRYYENSENFQTRWNVWLLDITNSHKTRWLIKLPNKVIWHKNKHCMGSVWASGCCSMNITFTSAPHLNSC